MQVNVKERPAARPPVQGLAGTLKLPGARRLCDGSVAGDLEIGYETVGAPGAPAIVVLGGISADRHVTSHAADPTPGWWEAVVGQGRAIDPAAWRIVGIDYIGGTGRSTAAAALPRDGDGVPCIGTADQAFAIEAVLDHLGIAATHAVVGASYGGMVALQLAAVVPARVGRAVVISAAHRSSGHATALRLLQRRVVRLAAAAGRPEDGVAIARGIALTTYRTEPELDARFGEDHGALDGYLTHHGRRFAARFAADTYLCLSASLDTHHLQPRDITVPTILVAVHEDTLVPIRHVRALRRELGGPARLVSCHSRYGHDAFLGEPGLIGGILVNALHDEVTS